MLGIAANWAGYAVTLVMLFVMVWNFGALAGWSPDEVVFMYAIWLFSYALGASFFYTLTRNFRNFAIDGTLDEAYTRPVSPFLYLVATNFNVGYVSQISLSAGAMAFSMVRLGVSFAWWQWIWFMVVVICGAIITACLMLICEMPAIRTRSRSPTSMFFWQTREFTQYPITIYPRAVQWVFTAVLPFGFVSFYPAQVLLGKTDGIAPGILMWLSPVVAVVMVGLTAWCWRVLSSRYESAGT